jgi:hypothetical protein
MFSLRKRDAPRRVQGNGQFPCPLGLQRVTKEALANYLQSHLNQGCLSGTYFQYLWKARGAGASQELAPSLGVGVV